MVGKANDMNFNPSIEIMDCQKSIYVSEGTLLWRMEELVKHLVRWSIHPDQLNTQRFELKDVDKAYTQMVPCRGGNVTIDYPD